MYCYKVINDGYILGIGTGSSASGDVITQEEYDEIMSILKNRPTAEEGYGYHLTEDLTWEQYELPIDETPDPQELTAEEALEIITGGEV